MFDIGKLDLKGFVSAAMTEVFDTMLSMEIEVLNSIPVTSEERNKIVGSVSFTGELMGNVNVQVGNDFARLATAEMLGMEPEEIEGDEEVHDVVGELSNMIGGDLKSRFDDIGFSCQLSIPSITMGNDFRIESLGWERNDIIAFLYNKYPIIVEVNVKQGN